jgi:acyl-CoA thioester hydrolase
MEGFRFTIPYEVRVADVNYGGHVSNAAVLNFFQDARIAYLGHLGPFSELDIGEGCGIILPESHVHYRAEMFLGDRLTIGVRVTEARNSSFIMVYRIERAGEIMAEGTTPLVAFDYERRKPRRLPAQFRQALTRFEEI